MIHRGEAWTRLLSSSRSMEEESSSTPQRAGRERGGDVGEDLATTVFLSFETPRGFHCVAFHFSELSAV